MNIKSQFKEINKLQEEKAQIEKRMSVFNKLLYKKVENLILISNSILRKLNVDLETKNKIFENDFSFLTLNLYYIQRFKVHSFSSYEEIFEFEYFLGNTDKVKKFKVPRKFFHMSDRDFAKLIRQKIKQHNDRVKEETRKNSVSEIKKNEKMIEKLLRENQKLQKIQEKITVQQEQKASRIIQEMTQKENYKKEIKK